MNLSKHYDHSLLPTLNALPVLLLLRVSGFYFYLFLYLALLLLLVLLVMLTRLLTPLLEAVVLRIMGCVR